MFGIKKTDTRYISHFSHWVWCWLCVMDSLVGILTFGYLHADWSMGWTTHYISKKLRKKKC